MEARFARRLASNDARTRAKAVRGLKKWMADRSGTPEAFSELQMLKLWRGLHMSMWHSDKPLVQEELADSLASFIHVLRCREVVLLFLKSFFSIMSREWLNIDRLRLDKYYMLIRRVIRQSFQYLMDNNWDKSLVESMVQLFSEGPLDPGLTKTCSGVQLHVVEVFLPELLTVAANSIKSECSHSLLQPFCHLLAHTRDPVTAELVESRVLSQLTVGKKAHKLNVDVGVVSEGLLGLAVSRDTVGRNRKTLYTLRKRLQDFTTDTAAQLDQSDEGIEVDVSREGELVEPEGDERDDEREGEAEEDERDDEREGEAEGDGRDDEREGGRDTERMGETEEEEMAAVTEGEDQTEPVTEGEETEKRGCGVKRHSCYRERVRTGRIVWRLLWHSRSIWGERRVVRYRRWRRLGPGEARAWALRVLEREERECCCCDVSDNEEEEEEESVELTKNCVHQQNENNQDNGYGGGIHGDGIHGDSDKPFKVKKRVSFGLHKNEIFTPST